MIAAIVQARMGSTRLPGKVLKKIAGKPLLEHIIDRVRESHLIEKIVIATTIKSEDQVISQVATHLSVESYVGSENDVLDRFYQSAKTYHADIIVRITPDDPFKDPNVIDKIINYYLLHRGDVDYVSNTIYPTYPEGLDVEIFSFKALEKAWKEAKKPSEREHVTPYIWNHPELFRLANVENKKDLSHLRWTLDNERDLKFAREVYKTLYKGNIFLMEDILNLLTENPELIEINKGAVRNEGYKKSVREEKFGEDNVKNKE